MYIINTCKHIWVYMQFCYTNDCHQVAPRGKHNQAKTTASNFPAQTSEVMEHLDQVKLDTDSGATAQGKKKPNKPEVESPCLLENMEERSLVSKIQIHDPLHHSDCASSYVHFQQLLV